MSAKFALLAAVSMMIGMGASTNGLSAARAMTEAQPDCFNQSYASLVHTPA